MPIFQRQPANTIPLQINLPVTQPQSINLPTPVQQQVPSPPQPVQPQPAAGYDSGERHKKVGGEFGGEAPKRTKQTAFIVPFVG